MNVVARDVVDCLEVFVPLPGALSTVEPATRVHAVAFAFAFFAFLGFLAGQAAAGASLRQQLPLRQQGVPPHGERHPRPRAPRGRRRQERRKERPRRPRRLSGKKAKKGKKGKGKGNGKKPHIKTIDGV